MKKAPNSFIRKYFKLIFTVLIVSMAIASTIFYFGIGSLIPQDGEKVVNSNKFYVLKGDPTDLQKQLFEKLSTQLDQNIVHDFDAVDLVVQNFVADYYTWDNKKTPYDIGGLTYIYGNENLNFYRTSRRYFYNSISTYLDKGISMTDLPEVDSVTTRSVNFGAGYDYYGDVLLSYYVEVDWTYKENNAIDMTKFPTFGAFTLIETEEGRYEIARFY